MEENRMDLPYSKRETVEPTLDRVSVNLLLSESGFYHHSLINLAERILYNREKAKDIVQETYIKVLESATDFKGTSSFRTYLYRIVINMCIDAKRKEKRWSTVAGLLVRDSATHRDSIDRMCDRDMVRSAFEKIPDTFRIPLILVEFDCLTYEEIAQTLHISINTVRTRIYRCREKLRIELLKMGWTP